MRAYFLIKSEPSVYAFSQLVKDKKATWDGVRNFEARNNLRAMKLGDLCLFYHSNEDKAVVGVAKVTKTAFQDPTTDEDWSAVEVAPVSSLKRPVTLTEIKESAKLSTMVIVKKSRLSVAPVTKAEFDAVLAASKTKLED
jgi:predicted RNA-binding protein with PUA-like domain